MEGPPYKKPRLSDDEEEVEEEDSTSLIVSHPPASPIIQVLPPEDVGASLTNAIEIGDDSDVLDEMDLAYADSTGLNNPSRIDNLYAWKETLDTNRYLNITCFHQLAAGLDYHLDISRDHGVDIWQKAYLDDLDFFETLAVYAIKALHDHQLFPPDDPTSSQRAGECIKSQHASLITLCARIVQVLPRLADNTTRRDSTQANKVHDLPFLNYILLLSDLTCDTTPALSSFAQRYRIDADALARRTIARFLSIPGSLNGLLNLYRSLIKHHQRIPGAWDAIRCIMVYFQRATVACETHFPLDSFQRALFDEFLQVTVDELLPIITKKHPNAVGGYVHDLAIDLGSRILTCHARCVPADIPIIYQKFVRSESDHLRPSIDISVEDCLASMTRGGTSEAADIIPLAWTVDTAWKWIQTENSGVVARGVEILGNTLQAWYRKYELTTPIERNPIIAYLIRFLQANAIPRFLFTSGLDEETLPKTYHIVGFLVGTHAYTDAETDLLWDASVNETHSHALRSGYAQLLEKLVAFRDFPHLHRILERYIDTSVEQLTNSVSRPALLRRILDRIRKSEEIAFVSQTYPLAIDLLAHLGATELTGVKVALWQEAMDHIIDFMNNDAYVFECQLEVYDRIGHAVVQQKAHQSETCTLVLKTILEQRPLTPDESKALLDRISVADMVEVLESRTKDKPTIVASTASFQVAVRLLNLKQGETNSLAYRLGSCLTNMEPNAQTMTLQALRFMSVSDVNFWPIVRRIVDKYSELVAPGRSSTELVDLLSDSISNLIAYPLENLSDVFSAPSWQNLVAIAVSSDQERSQPAVQSLCQFLLDRNLHYSPDSLLQAQEKFIGTLLEKDFEDPCLFKGVIALLSILLKQTNISQSRRSSRQDSDLVVLSHPESKDELRFDILLFGPEVRTYIPVLSSMMNKVRDLVPVLAGKTGTADFSIFSMGHLMELSELHHMTLQEAGVQTGGKMILRPSYRDGYDIDKALTPATSIQHSILQYHQRFDDLLDTDRGEEVYLFLRDLPVPSKARVRILNGHNPISLSVHQTFRAAYSIHVLCQHLADLRAIGAIKFPAGRSFVRRGLDCLTTHVVDESAETPSLKMALGACRLFLAHDEGYGFPPDFQPKLNNILQHSTNNDLVLVCYDIKVATQNVSTNEDLDLHATLLAKHHGVSLERLITSISSVCETKGDGINPDAARARCSFFRNASLMAIVQGLDARQVSMETTALAVDLIIRDESLSCDETKVRHLIANFSERLVRYEHREHVSVPMVDGGMVAVLRVLNALIIVLKSFKHALQLDDLAHYLFKELLFPPLHQGKQPLLDTSTRKLALDVLQSTDCKDMEIIGGINQAVVDIGSSHHGDGALSNCTNPLRPAICCSGLVNRGLTCFLNSLLQQMFANVSLRSFLLNVQIHDRQKQAALDKIQGLFSRMQESRETFQDAESLLSELDCEKFVQYDAHEKYSQLLDAIESTLPDEESRSSFKRFFTGTQVVQIRTDGCDHVSSTEQEFCSLQLEINGKMGVEESLRDSMTAQRLVGQNQYRCSRCDTEKGQLHNASMRSCPRTIPDNLTLALKRFAMDDYGQSSKLNGYFQFPEQLDMNDFQLESRGNDIFELVGVIVHLGSLNNGHYWSYVKLRNESKTWIKLEDEKTQDVVDIHYIQRECFGGVRDGYLRQDSAYVLFYQRQSAMVELLPTIITEEVDPAFAALLPPRVHMPTSLYTSIEEENQECFRQAHLISADFISYVQWIVRSTVETSMDSTMRRELARIVILLSSRIRYLDSGSWPKISVILKDVMPKTDRAISDDFVALLEERYTEALSPSRQERAEQNEMSTLSVVITNNRGIARREALAFILQVMHWHKERQEAGSEEDSPGNNRKSALHRFMKSFIEMRDRLDLCYDRQLSAQLLPFWGDIAQIGPDETALMLSREFLVWGFEIINTCHLNSMPTIHRGPWQAAVSQGGLNLHPVFTMIAALVANVDLSVASGSVKYQSNSYILSTMEMKCLTWESQSVQGESRNWLEAAMTHSTTIPFSEWRKYPAGKLVGLLSRPEVNCSISKPIYNWLLDRYRWENNSVSALYNCTMHYLDASGTDGPAEQVLIDRLSNELLEWDNVHDHLSFMSLAAELAPVAIWEASRIFVPKWIFSRKPSERQATLVFLQGQFFTKPIIAESLDGYDALEYKRIRALCHVISELMSAAGGQLHRWSHVSKRAEVCEALRLSKVWLLGFVAQIPDIAMTSEQNSFWLNLIRQTDPFLDRLTDNLAIIDGADVGTWDGDDDSVRESVEDDLESLGAESGVNDEIRF